MKNIILSLLTLLSLSTATAQTFAPGYYHLQVIRQGSVVSASNGQLTQSTSYNIPTVYTLADLPYIWKFETAQNGFLRIQNCKSLEYIQHPDVNLYPYSDYGSALFTTHDPSQADTFTPVASSDGRFWGFQTDALVPRYLWNNETQMYDVVDKCYLNDYNGTSLCLWMDGPDKDTGSCFTVVPVDDDVVEQLMSNTTPGKEDLVTFMPDKGVTYTIYAPFTSGYMCGEEAVSGVAREDNEYAIEQVSTTADNLPTFRLRQVSTNTYLQHVNLSGVDDSSDLGLTVPHGPLATAATFTILRANRDKGDPRTYAYNSTDGDYVICDTQTLVEYGVTRYTFLEGYAGNMFYGPYNESNHLRIAPYVSTEAPQTEYESFDDESVNLWGAAADTTAVRLDDGTTLLIPSNMVESWQDTQVTLKGDSVIAFRGIVPMPVIDESFPAFRTFKFNNKYNDILIADAAGTVMTDSINIQVGSCIGKTLCPSFSLTDEGANVYYRGHRQLSHHQRVRFDKVLTYTVARPGYRILMVNKVQDEVWTEPTVAGEEKQVTLRADQLSTNAPSNYNEGVDCLVDGNLDNYYHSTWGSGIYQKLDYYNGNPSKTVWPYVDIHLDAPLQVIKWGFTTQSNGSNRLPGAIDLLASNDGQNWTRVASFTDLPKSFGATFMSDVIDMGAQYSYLRVLLTAADYKNYLCMAEMYLYTVSTTTTGGEPEKLQDAIYRYNSRPWGRDVRVKADFLTDLSSNVPTININLEGGVYYGSITKNEYLPATITIDGGGVFPDMVETPVNIRGRGNSSWSYSKKPYRLKFASKVKPFGLTKGKSWVLIAQAQTGSMLTNPVAQRVATMTGTLGCNHVIPVELYINGSYRGSYFFSENPGFSNNSIDIDETSAYMLELDSYYDEDYKFRDENYNLPVNIKEPDLTEELDYNVASDKFYTILNDFNTFTKAVRSGDADTYERMIDIDSYSRFMLVNDVVRNTELNHPKSTKLFRVDMNQDLEDSPYAWGPVWDFDWAFGYEGTRSYCIQQAETDFFTRYTIHNLFIDMQQQSTALNADRYRVWTEFMQTYRDELIDYVDDYYAYAAPSFTHNASIWSDGRSYSTVVENTKEWLRARTNFVYSTMQAFPLPEVIYELGDVNEDGRISIGDAICIVNHLLSLPVDVFNADRADMNSDARISVADMQLIIRAILAAAADPTSVRNRMPKANASLQLTPFTATAGESIELPVVFNTDEAAAGLQMEVILPEGATLTNVRTTQALAPFRTRLSDMGDGRYRVLVYAANGERVAAEAEAGLMLDVTMGQIPADKSARRIRIAQAVMATPEGSDCALPTSSALFAETTGIADITADDMIVLGGDDLTIHCVKDGTVQVHNLAGQLVTTVHVTRGTTTVNLPMGIYIVAGHKIAVD